LLPTFFSLAGIASAFLICSTKRRPGQGLLFFNKKGFQAFLFRRYRKGYKFLSNKWNFDLLYNHYIVLPFLRKSYKYFFRIDQDLLKVFGPVGAVSVIYRVSKRLVKKQQSGLINNYAFCMSYILLVFLFLSWLGFVVSP
jgi:NADH:ubiquinone oxidoreductase subunit 5 (subunit L)/multisubunit Na+/H+ antiporter MnhA subunit